MMEVLREIRDRRSVRKYTDKEVTDEQVALLIEAAMLAPSGKNSQPWDFIVIKSEEMREKVCRIDHNQRWMMEAPVFIACVGNEKYRGDGDMFRVIRDTTIATEHILLQAEHMGLATCWTGWYDPEEMREALGLDEKCYVVGIITVGYAAVEAPAVSRRKTEYKVI